MNIDEKIDMTGLNSTVREGYELLGWYTSGGVKWDEGGAWGVTPEYCDKDGSGQPIVKKNDKRRYRYYTLTLTAHWTPAGSGQSEEPDGAVYTVTLDGNGGTFDDEGTSDDEGLRLRAATESIAPEPTRDHYDFAGWYPALPGKMPNSDLEAKATWTPKVYSVAFFDGDTQLFVLKGARGSSLEAPEAPVRDGKVFAGWVDYEGNPVTFPMYVPAADLTRVYATWKGAQEPPATGSDPVAEAYAVRIAEPVAGAEYVIVPAGQQPGAKDWAAARQAGGGEVVFDGLEPATSYDVWCRMAATDDKAASEPAKAASVTTLKEAQVAPAAPAVALDGATTMRVMDPVAGQEYALVAEGEAPGDGAQWKSPGEGGKVEWAGLSPETWYDVYARYAETDTKAASEPSPPETVRTGTPDEPEPTPPTPTPTPEPTPTPAPTPTPTPAPAGGDRVGVDGQPCGPGASAATAERAVLALPDGADPAGSTVAPLLLKSAKQTKASVRLAWAAPAGAERFVVYGAACGKGSGMERLAEVAGKGLVVKQVAGKKLAKGAYHRFVVVALDKGGSVV